ncbi:hypothetical protein BACERE00185_04096 [Bacillus mobilis]|uniref:Uncharacterized protein n=1 Tax=Bacillus mobilis TaxID=2026190 RepID=A0A1Y6AD03_9BACI|nr:hypothetical protein BACERE00185_04096 [Bacillus mobilis]
MNETSGLELYDVKKNLDQNFIIDLIKKSS